MGLNPDVVCNRLRSVGLTQKHTHHILNTILLWQKSNGTEWTIKRLKAYKVAYVNLIAGDPRPFKHSPWISYNHKTNIPKGCFGPIFKMRRAQKAIAVLMLYTTYVAKKVTTTQLQKFVSAVTLPTKADSLKESYILNSIEDKVRDFVISLDTPIRRSIENQSHLHPSTFADRHVRTPCLVPGRTSKGRICIDGSVPDVVKTSEMNLDVFIQSFNHPIILDYYDGLLDIPNGVEEIINSTYFMGDTFGNTDVSVVGKIGFIQEPGFKLRAVANPFPSMQVALSRLGARIYSLLNQIPEDCTFDQTEATTHIQNFLNSELNVNGLMSIDLSSATDRFPMALQVKVLHVLAHKGLIDWEDVDLFEKVSSSNFIMPDGSTIKWEVGQPLGVFPSFGVFALTHNMLVRLAEPTFYRVLGDDVIVDSEAGSRLRVLYDALGLDISEDKSINSLILGEFGGRLIAKHQFFVQPKWKDISDHSFLDLARNLGPKSMALFKPRQIKILKILSDVHPDVHPWGLNWNVQGLTYDSRIRISKEVMDRFLDEGAELVEAGKNQSEQRDLKWGMRVKDFADHGFLLPKPPIRHSSRAAQIALFESLPLGALGKALFIDGSDLDQFGLNCSDIIHEFYVSKLHVDICDELPYGYSLMPRILKSDPRGPSLLEVAEKKLKKPSPWSP